MVSVNKVPAYIKITLIAVGVIACSYILVAGAVVIVPLLYATLFAILLNPGVAFLTGKKIHRVAAISITMLVAFLLVSALACLLLAQFQTLSSTFPGFKDKLFLVIKDAIEWLTVKANLSPEQINNWIANLKSQAMQNSGNYISQSFTTLVMFAAALVIIPVYIFMLLYYMPLIMEFIRQLFSKEYHASVVEVMTQIRAVVQSYLRGLMIEMVIVAVLNSIALLAIGVEYAILLGIFGAVLNIIPYLGGIVAVALSMIVALVNQDALHMFLVLGAYALIQFIDNNYIVPAIVASKVQVNALISVIGVIIGGALWGIAGMFLSIPLLAVTKIICDHIDYLKPWGYLLGDTMPRPMVVEAFLKKGNTKTSSAHK